MKIILKQMIAILHLLGGVSMLQRASFSSYSNYIYYIYCVDIFVDSCQVSKLLRKHAKFKFILRIINYIKKHKTD